MTTIDTAGLRQNLSETINAVNHLAEVVRGTPIWKMQDWCEESGVVRILEQKIQQTLDGMIAWHKTYCEEHGEQAKAVRKVFELYLILNEKLERLKRRIIAKGGR